MLRKPRPVVLGAILFTTFLVWYLRHHLRDLIETGRTFASFHRYIHCHPKVLYPYSANSSRNEASWQGKLDSGIGDTDRAEVPKIIHQILLGDSGRPFTSYGTIEEGTSCQKIHSSWQYHLWRDVDANAFIDEHYPFLSSHYKAYGQNIQRANILRYALLHKFGGVYLDLDIECITPLDNLLRLPFLTPGAYPTGQNNAFILARPEHPFLGEVLEHVASRDLVWPLPYVQNMLSTGCVFFSNRWMAYVSRSEGYSADDDRVYMLTDANGKLEPHMLRGIVATPLFVHGGASSWHQWDARLIIGIGAHYRICTWLVVLAVLMACALASRKCLYRPKSKLALRSEVRYLV